MARTHEFRYHVEMVSVFLKDQEIVFLHVPKTAGGSISRALRHRPDAVLYPVQGMAEAEPCAQQLQRQMDLPLSKCHTVAVVRNPWDWAVSGYLHVTQNFPAYAMVPSFRDFVRGAWKNPTIRQYPAKFSNPTAYVAYHTQITQWEHLTINGSRLAVTTTCRFETLEKDVRDVFDLEIELPHANKSDREAYASYYDEETKQLVADRNAPLIEEFNYKF